MSSVFGHVVAAGSIYLASTRPEKVKSQVAWLGWLMLLAVIPDMDYLMPFLRIQSGESYIRISHSIVGCLIFPLLTILGWLSWRYSGKELLIKAVQAMLAGLSHLFLDGLVGVFPHAILWPLSDEVFKLDFGLLPSAGKIDLSNYFFYHNTLLEMVIFLPIIGLILLKQHQQRFGRWQYLFFPALFLVSIFGLILGYQLDR